MEKKVCVQKFPFYKYLWGHNSVVECPLRMRKAPGSNPGASKNAHIFFAYHHVGTLVDDRTHVLTASHGDVGRMIRNDIRKISQVTLAKVV